MATKLKNLKITKVDFVDQGANPEANVLLFKHRDGKTQESQMDNPVPVAEKQEGMFKRFVTAIGKAIGLKLEEIDATIEEIAKNEAETFDTKMFETTRRKITDEIWDLCYALQESLRSIICDEDVENPKELMSTSLGQFVTVMNTSIEQWSMGKTSDSVRKAVGSIGSEELTHLKLEKARIDTLIEKTETQKETVPDHPPKHGDDETIKEGDVEEMNIDKSKLTPTEKRMLEDLEKRYGANEGQQDEIPPVAETLPLDVAGTDDLYKGINPAIVAELQDLRKRAEAVEDAELLQVAKKYELLGKEPEKFSQTLKALKKSAPNAYIEMIAVMDASVDVINKAGIFSEIGKSGGAAEVPAWTQIEKKAVDLMATNTSLTHSQAIDAVCQQNPALVHEYEQSI